MRASQILIFIGLVFAGVLGSPGEAAAWGKFGHLTICDLAYRNFTSTTRRELRKLLQVAKGGITVDGRGELPDRHYTSFNLGCLEEDALPRRHPKDHFINVDRETKSISTNACPGNADCILSGIERDIAILKDTTKSNEERVFALMALGHWIGDIHQPLHVSFADDKGGNSIEVRLTGKCGRSTYRVKNLHGMWDNCLLEAGLFERVRQRADFKSSWGKNTITYRAVDTLQANTTLTEEKSLVGTDSWRWANESYEITLKPEVLYCTVVGNACQYSPTVVSLPHRGQERRQQLDHTYLASFERVAEDRVRRAGFRLAHIVNLALDPAYTEPVQNSTQGP